MPGVYLNIQGFGRSTWVIKTRCGTEVCPGRRLEAGAALPELLPVGD